jgi:hypothetical protein
MLILGGSMLEKYATFERQFVCKNIEDTNVVGVNSVRVGFVLQFLYYFLRQYKLVYLAPLRPQYCWMFDFM